MVYLKMITSGRRQLGRLASYTAELGRASWEYRWRHATGVDSVGPGVTGNADGARGAERELDLAALLASAYPPQVAPAAFKRELGARLMHWQRVSLRAGAADGDEAVGRTVRTPVDEPMETNAPRGKHRSPARHWTLRPAAQLRPSWDRLRSADACSGVWRSSAGQADLLLRGGALVGALSVIGLFWLGRSGRPM